MLIIGFVLRDCLKRGGCVLKRDRPATMPYPPTPRRAGLSLPITFPDQDAVERVGIRTLRLPAGLRPAEILLFSVWWGGKAAPPNRKQFFAGAGGPRAPTCGSCIAPLGRGGTGGEGIQSLLIPDHEKTPPERRTRIFFKQSRRGERCFAPTPRYCPAPVAKNSHGRTL